MKWAAVAFLMRFEYEVVDEAGNFPEFPPVLARSDPQVCAGLLGDCFDLALTASLPSFT